MKNGSAVAVAWGLVLLASGCGADSGVPAPSITSISPNESLTRGGAPVVITGTNFQNGAVVYFDSSKVASLFLSTTSISLTAPAYESPSVVFCCEVVGSFSVTVVNPDLHSVTLGNGFTYWNCFGFIATCG
jgi:hypothetical protein